MPSIALQNPAKKNYMIALAVFTWIAIALQLYLTTGSMANFFSYFTILSNLLVAISLTYCLLSPSSRPGIFFSKPSVQSGIALYIFIVGLVYNTVLRGIVALSGINWVVDNMLHVIVPIFYVVYWFLFVPKGVLRYKDGIPWTLFPVAYLIYSMIRGSITHWYPYPFLNADIHGYQKVMVNIVLMIAAFFAVGLLLIAVNRSIKPK